MALLIGIYFGLSSPFFFTWDNVLIIGATAAPLGIMAFAQTFLIVSGGIDVSVGSVVAITTVTAGLLMQGGRRLLACRWRRGRGRSRRRHRQRDPRGRSHDQSVHRDARHAVCVPGPRVRGDRRPNDRGRRSDARLHRDRNLFGLPVPFIVFLIVVRDRRDFRTIYPLGPDGLRDRRQCRSGTAVGIARAIDAGRSVHPVGHIRRRGGRPHPRTAVGGEPPGRRHVPAVGRDGGHPRRRESGRWQGHGRRNGRWRSRSSGCSTTDLRCSDRRRRRSRSRSGSR